MAKTAIVGTQFNVIGTVAVRGEGGPAVAATINHLRHAYAVRAVTEERAQQAVERRIDAQ